MYKCELGCGLVVWDIDAHIDTAHPEKRGEFPVALTHTDARTADWDSWFDNDDAREKFINYNFEKVSVVL